jgi:predicted Mrr-cat superfamily restriction endonuclease
MDNNQQSVFFVRQYTESDLRERAINENKIFIGWATNDNWIDETNYYEFRDKIKVAHYMDDSTYRRAGYATGTLWRFFKDIIVGTLVIIPDYMDNSNVYVGKVTSECKYNPEWISEDRAYYHDVEWISGPIKRAYFDNTIIRAMKYYGTITDISEYSDDINRVIVSIEKGIDISFKEDVRNIILPKLLEMLYRGKIDDWRFERLIEELYKRKGYTNSQIISRNKDVGTDIECDLDCRPYSGNFKVHIQAKQYEPGSDVDVHVCEKLIQAMGDRADFGVIVTTGKLSDEALAYVENVQGGKLGYIDGEMLYDELIATGIFPDFDILQPGK